MEIIKILGIIYWDWSGFFLHYKITKKIKEMAGWLLRGTQPDFINGLIRKYNPKIV